MHNKKHNELKPAAVPPPSGEKQSWWKKPDWWMVFVTVPLAVFAGWTLWEIHQSAVRDQRAWLGVVEVTNFDFKAKPGFSIPFDMMNSGKTPALNVQSEVSLKSLEKEKDFIATYDDPRPLKTSSYVVQPQMHIILYTLPTDISEKQYGDIANRRGILYGYGKITYDDIFGKEHHTTFCVMYWAGLPAPIACNTYNTAD